MIYIVHGEDAVKSRTLLVNQQKKLGIETKIELDAKEITPQEFFEHISQQDIFGIKKFIVLNVPNIKFSYDDVYVEMLNKADKEITLVIYAEKPLPKKNIFIQQAKNLKAKIIENEYTPQSNVFRFTDNLFNKKRETTYRELEKLIEEGVDEFRIFASVLYGLRNITYCLYENELFDKLKPFQKGKITDQANKYSKDSIKSIYQTLYELERKVKTGKITPDIMLVRSIEKILNS